MIAKAFIFIIIIGLIVLAIALSLILRIILWIRDLLTGKDHTKYRATNSSFGYDYNRGASAQDNMNSGSSAQNDTQSSARHNTSQPSKRKKIYDDNEGEYAEFEEIE